jgi:hypothetical protein
MKNSNEGVVKKSTKKSYAEYVESGLHSADYTENTVLQRLLQCSQTCRPPYYGQKEVVQYFSCNPRCVICFPRIPRNFFSHFFLLPLYLNFSFSYQFFFQYFNFLSLDKHSSLYIKFIQAWGFERKPSEKNLFSTLDESHFHKTDFSHLLRLREFCNPPIV